MNNAPEYRYDPIFDDRERPALRRRPSASEIADRSIAAQYVFDDNIRLTVNLAIATGRPLLVSGPSGSGKSSLARAVADLAAWSYVEQTITSRLQARELLYEVDHLKRLQDAQQNKLTSDERPYIVPGPLFWAFAPQRAHKLLAQTGREVRIPSGIKQNADRVVVLLDEVDKADPDVPNDLLIPLGQLSFEIIELGETIACRPDTAPLLVLTTNGERDMPPAFLRRCVELQIRATENSPEGRSRLLAIVRKHRLDLDDKAFDELADAFFAAPRPERREPNAAEFLDLVRAWQHLKLTNRTHKPTVQTVLAAITVGAGMNRP
jgi:MoxR-like ATPase